MNSYSQWGSLQCRRHDEPPIGFVMGQMLRGWSLILSIRAAIRSFLRARRSCLRLRRFCLRFRRFSIISWSVNKALSVLVRKFAARAMGNTAKQHRKTKKRRSGCMVNRLWYYKNWMRWLLLQIEEDGSGGPVRSQEDNFWHDELGRLVDVEPHHFSYWVCNEISKIMWGRF